MFFRTIRRTPQIWEGNGGTSYSLNVAYMARGRPWAAVEWSFFPYFPLKPRCVLWSEKYPRFFKNIFVIKSVGH